MAPQPSVHLPVAPSAGGLLSGVSSMPMGAHLKRAGGSSRFSFLWQTFEQTTTWYNGPSAVLIEVGLVVGLLNFVVHMALLVYIVYTCVTTNVYLKEEVPIGQFSFWPDTGTERARGLVGAEQLSGDLCKYNASYDYLYGLDNIWDYSVIGCEWKSPGYVSFKGPNSMHFVSYEQRRQVATIAKTGPSCDEECQSVYPEWPGTASYGERSWQSVHVDTKLFLAAKARHPELADLPNVRMAKPEDLDGDCACVSFENVFLAGAEKLGMALSHRYMAETMAGSSKESGESAPTSFLMTELGNVFKTFPKGDLVKFTVEEVLEAFDSCMDCQPSAAFYGNSLCDGGPCPEPYRLKPTPRITGSQFDIRTEYYSHTETMPNGPGYDEIKEAGEPPYAVHVVRHGQDWTSRGSDYTILVDSEGRKVEKDTYRYGTLIRIQPAAGIISKPDYSVVVTKLVEFKVLTDFPSFIIGFVVLTLLGHKSTILRKAQQHQVSMSELYRAFTYSAIVAEEAFERMDTRGDEFLTLKELEAIMKKSFLGPLKEKIPGKTEQWYDDKISEFAERMIFPYEGKEDLDTAGTEEGEAEEAAKATKVKGISKKDFIECALKSEALDWADVVGKMEHPSRDHDPLDRAFHFCRKRLTKKAKASE